MNAACTSFSPLPPALLLNASLVFAAVRSPLPVNPWFSFYGAFVVIELHISNREGLGGYHRRQRCGGCGVHHRESWLSYPRRQFSPPFPITTTTYLLWRLYSLSRRRVTIMILCGPTKSRWSSLVRQAVAATPVLLTSSGVARGYITAQPAFQSLHTSRLYLLNQLSIHNSLYTTFSQRTLATMSGHDGTLFA